MSATGNRYLVETDWLESHLDDPEIRILDCTTYLRASEEGYHMESGLETWQKGHIPTSINIPALELVDRRTRSYLPIEELAAIFAPVLDADPSGIITYCGDGAAGSSVAFALKLIGVENVSVYDGALIEWASDPDLPMETD